MCQFHAKKPYDIILWNKHFSYWKQFIFYMQTMQWSKESSIWKRAAHLVKLLRQNRSFLVQTAQSAQLGSRNNIVLRLSVTFGWKIEQWERKERKKSLEILFGAEKH